ncbi:MAG: CHAP domain-containing protein [Oscillospiraceae bacterium]|nr:CHAP domain-containing protein [Oscillospiraceae bacterium]
MKQICSLFTVLLLLFTIPSSLAAKSTPTPAPVEIETEVIESVPEKIQQLLDLAYSQLVETNGAELKEKNKFTKWRNNYSYGWCCGFITWCMLELNVPQQVWNKTPKKETEGIVHVKEAGVGKLVTGYMRMNRTTMVPQKGFISVFGNRNKKFGGSTPLYHVGLVWDVEKLANGKYRVTTIEGNVSMRFTDADGVGHKAGHTIRMYTRDYDMYAEKANNLSLVPEEERTTEETLLHSYGYTYGNDSLYVHMYLMPWVPGDDTL